ncbi:unnamed protein product [Kuraishia capsulata CBS 1993]|uniref:Uncharacterized protein n=1 Tax=Kuraishia capsulata CBS 1993 TaxID=1382522 RepID=W6MMJ0_9ASCO|nr:uncharacterized protein KUCA_T00003750001 [Kuraishia capsulata CBS 1993]CDK27771.1 unnamed protein product [Kuraishia capsulata CBS 1993]
MSSAAHTYAPTVEPPSYNDAEALDGMANYSTPEPRESQIPNDFKFSTNVSECDVQIRQVFLRKVYSLLCMQLLTTFLTGAVIYNNTAIKDWCLNNMWMFFVSIAGSFGFMIAAYIKSKSYPYNLLLLTGFTLCESYGVGLATSLFDSNVVLQAVLITLIVFLGLTIFTFQTKYDFTQWQGWASGALFALLGFGIVGMFLPYNSGMEVFYSWAGALLFSVFIVIDTQMIMKKFHPDEEVSATIILYLDVINLFLKVLAILSNRERN